jgi:tripartite-type tricarboxylate transporter receptor subunit TctC
MQQPRCRRRGIAIALTLAVAAVLARIGPAPAQDYPLRPITMIVPLPAGGPSDSIGRIFADRMSVALGKPVIVENISGGSGSIGIGRAARAAGDGYTLSYGSWGTSIINGALLTLPYDLVADFKPVALLVDAPMVIIGRKDMPAADLKGLTAWLGMNPDKASAGTAGPASASHLAGVFFQKETGTRFQFVPYRGLGPALQDLVAGRIDLIFDLAANSAAQVRAGSIKAYAVLAKNRLESLPEVPTVDEAGSAGLYMSSWQAIWVPKGTPQALVDKLNAAVVAALADPAVRARLGDLALEIPPRAQQTPEALDALQKAEIGKWWPIIKSAGIKIE